MDQIAFLFSGQGAQYPGMGKELCGVSKAAANVFQLADHVRPGTSAQCFDGTAEELARTINTQPCMYCVDLAAAMALQEQGIEAAAVAGFSLGEIAALTFSGILSQKQGIELVCRRAEWMEEATAGTNGGMAAVLKLDHETVKRLCGVYSNVYPVNDNCPGQIAVAGEQEQLKAFCEDVQKAGGRAVPLKVSGAFHSPFMEPAARHLEEELTDWEVSSATLPLYANMTAACYPDSPNEIKRCISSQVCNPVRWREILQNMWSKGIHTFVEVGAGKTLSGFVKKTLPQANIYRVEDKQTLEETLKELKGD